MRLNEEEKEGLTTAFNELDKDQSRTLTIDEIKEGCAKQCVALPEYFDAIFRSLDTDKSGHVDYIEFIAATMNVGAMTTARRQVLMQAAFRLFKADDSEGITAEKIESVLTSAKMKIPEEDVKQIMERFDTDKDGSFKLFGAQVLA